MLEQLAALHMSAHGTTRTSQHVCFSAACGGLSGHQSANASGHGLLVRALVKCSVSSAGLLAEPGGSGASPSLRLVSSIRFAETVLNGPAVLASVEGLISPWPIEPTVTSVPAISVTFPSIPFPVPVPGAVVVVAIAGSRVIAEIEIDALR
jgi:hypothetical protein